MKTCDYDLRHVVVQALLAHGTPRAAIKHEITLDSDSSDGRADIVVALDDELIGIEIKSGKDKLDRLETQRDQYRRRFDRMCLVVDERHVPEGVEGLRFAHASRFGAVAVVGRGEAGTLGFVERSMYGTHGVSLPWKERYGWERRGARDMAFQTPAAMLSLLWRDEITGVAAALVQGKVIPPVQADTRAGMIPHLAENAPIIKLRPLIAQALRSRSLNKWEEAYWARHDTEAIHG